MQRAHGIVRFSFLPFGTVDVFAQLSHGGHTAWLAVPFSVLVAWMYVSLDQVGESTGNPFEGGANDVPITHVFRMVEIEMREMLGETDLPPSPQAKNDILM
jgi:putative membrane protein